MEPNRTPKKWYVGPWPTLAWVETILKLIALGAALMAVSKALTVGSFQPPLGKTWVEIIIMVVLSLGLLLAIYDRILEREIIAMAFLILNNLGHWGMTAALLTKPKPDHALLLFSLLMLLGDLIKLVFLKVHDFEVRDTPKAVLYGLTGLYIVGYLTLALLELAF